MRTCIRCHQKNITDNKRICTSCLNEWTSMRAEIYEALETKLGKFGPSNFETFKVEMKRMDKLWHKDRPKYHEELNLIKGDI